MKRSVLSLALILIFLSSFVSSIYAGEVRVDIMGAEDLTRLAPGIQNSIIARSIAKGICLEDYPELDVTILEMGDTLSFDAILKTTPPRGFHSDLNETSGITVAIDDMIARLFDQTPAVRQEPEQTPAENHAAQQPGKEIKLAFVATSVISQGSTLYISDAKTLYKIKDERPQAEWNTKGNDEIFRLFSYGDSIIALVKRGHIFNTFQIKEGKTVKHWNKAVIPIGNSLVSSQLTSDTDLPDAINIWPHPVSIAGETYPVPGDADLPSMIMGDIMRSYSGNEFINFNRRGHLSIENNGQTVWSSATDISPLPLYVEQDIYADDPPQRYYMMPRILMRNGDLITINNIRGLSKVFGNIILYTGSDILAFTPEKSDTEGRSVSHIQEHYCADIALNGSTLIALIINNKKSYVRMFDL